MQKLLVILVLLFIGYNGTAQDITPPRSRVTVIIDIDKKHSGKYMVTTDNGQAHFNRDSRKKTDVKSFDYELDGGNTIVINIFKKRLLGGYKTIKMESTKYNKDMPYLVLSLNKNEANENTFNVLWSTSSAIKAFKEIEKIYIFKYISNPCWL